MAPYISVRKISAVLLSIALALVSVPVFAQEADKDRLYVFDDFSKGIDSKTSLFALPKGFATIAENVRFGEELKSLSKRTEMLLYGTADTTEPITGMHRLYLTDGTKVLLVTHGDEIEKGSDTAGTFTKILDLSIASYRWKWLTWHNMAIGTDGYNSVVKYDGSSASATYLGSCLATDAGSGAGPSGTYTYKISYYTTSYEVLFNTASNPVTVTDNDISLSMIPIAPTTYGGEDVTGRKVYRIKNGGSTYYLLSNGTIANNTTTTLTDTDTDGEVSATSYPAGNATYAPPKCKYAIIHKNRLWLFNDPTSGPSRAYYSEDGLENVFITNHYFEVRQNDGDEITFAENLLGILTIGKNNSIQKLYTDRTSPTADWSISDPFSTIGCQAPYSAVNTPSGIVYLGRDGIYQFNGQYSKLISDAVTPIIKDISPSNVTDSWGIFHKSIYYLTYTSEASGSTSNDRVLLLDTLSNAYSLDIMSVNAFATFSSGTDWDILYSGSSTSGAVYAHAKSDYSVIHKKHTDFTGTWDDAGYIPTGIPGGDANDPVIELRWTEALDDIATTINNTTGDINRPDTDGTYTSQALEVGAASFDKLYWHERFSATGEDITFNIRSASTDVGLASATWSTAYTDPTGSDISSETANTFIQYKINLSTTDIDYTPELYRANNYVVKLTYNKEGATTESTVGLQWKSGYLDFGLPGYKKSLRKIIVLYESESTGTLTLKFTTIEGDEDTFDIDLKTNPSKYEEYFENGILTGEYFTLEISESSLNDLTIQKIYVVYDVEVLY